MDGVNLENDVKVQIHDLSLWARPLIFDRIIEDNVLITYMKFL